jgi:cell wall-associated NlpC family hydrolase
MSGIALAEAARALVGSPYRRDGRDPATGLDCLGVIAVALTAIGRSASLPARSTLRRRELPDLEAIAGASGLLRAGRQMEAGDILLVRCSPVQWHALVAATADRFVHAHAGLRRVVLGPADPAWAPAGHWRLLSIL